MTLIDNGPGHCRNYEETAVFNFCRKVQNVLEHGVDKEVNVFLGPKFQISAIFGYRTLDFVNGTFVALDETIDLAPSDQFFNFSFPSYARFRKKKNWPTRQKVFPSSIVEAPSASNSPSALSAQSTQAGKVKTNTAEY